MIYFGRVVILHRTRLLIVILSILFAGNVFATTWYVRPSGGSYGNEDGTTYADAWDGFTNITWGTGGVGQPARQGKLLPHSAAAGAQGRD